MAQQPADEPTPAERADKRINPLPDDSWDRFGKPRDPISPALTTVKVLSHLLQVLVVIELGYRAARRRLLLKHKALTEVGAA